MKSRMPVPVDYIIVSILANTLEDVRTIPTSKPTIHKMFFDWRTRFTILRNIPFEKNYFPYSETIAQAFDNIEMSGLIGKVNPAFRDFTLNKDSLKKFFNNEIKSILRKKDLKEVEEMGKQLSRHF
ncbi:MAG: hypothetical protein ACYDHW_09610 [Syntrophorhabdaceae bacterium]